MGEITIIGNPKLRDLAGLQTVEHVAGAVQIDDNDALASLHGLENLTGAYYLWVDENARLASLGALTSFARAEQVAFTFNPSLPACEARALATRTGALVSAMEGNDDGAVCR